MFATGRPLGPGKTHISKFTASRQDADLRAGDATPDFDYLVHLEGGPMDVLKGIVHAVYPILAECETGEPLSLFAPYPQL
jgi:hypothetical protein